MVKVELSEFELKICRIIAEERENNNERNRIRERKISEEEAVELHYSGLIGEFVVAKYLNIYPDFTTESRSGGHELTYRGWAIDAKYSKNHRDMHTPTYKKLGSADIYVRVFGGNPYEIVGWCFEQQLIRPENIRMLLKETYVFPEIKLNRPEHLLNINDREEWTIIRNDN